MASFLRSVKENSLSSGRLLMPNIIYQLLTLCQEWCWAIYVISFNLHSNPMGSDYHPHVTNEEKEAWRPLGNFLCGLARKWWNFASLYNFILNSCQNLYPLPIHSSSSPKLEIYSKEIHFERACALSV